MSGHGALSIVALGLLACGGPVASTPASPFIQSLEQSGDALDYALETAREAADEQETIAFRARYNPASGCVCPAWEIDLRGQWTRVFFEPAPDGPVDVATLDERAADELRAGHAGVWRARGRLAVDWQRDEVSGLEYPVLQLVSVEPVD